MAKKLFFTNNDISIAILRITLGIVMLGHGLQKAFGLFGGFGWTNTVHYFTDTVGVPAALGGFIILIETVGALLLIFGFAGRIQAALMIAVITGAFFVDHLPNGFFMNWNMEANKGEGWEYFILLFALAIIVLIKGGGKASIDAALTKKSK